MQNLRTLLNTLSTNSRPLILQKNENDRKLFITVTAPYNDLGFNLTDWTEIKSRALSHWHQEVEDIAHQLNKYVLSIVTSRYINLITKLLPQSILPTIIISILGQADEQPNPLLFSQFGDTPLPIDEYLRALESLSRQPLFSYTATSRFVIDLDSDLAWQHLENGVTLIRWDSRLGKKNRDARIFGLVHIWDHYDFPHIHVIDAFDEHRYMLLNAVKRTWIAMKEVTAGTKSSNTRVNYGYTARKLIPPYTKEQYELLGKLNYGTVILPPYEISEIRQMSLQKIESIILSTLKCLRIKPTINTVYITSRQLLQEVALGNNPLPDRYTLALPLMFTDKLTLFQSYSTRQLPTGPSFDPQSIVRTVELIRRQVPPNIIPTYPQVRYVGGYASSNPHDTKTILPPSSYATYLDVLTSQTTGQALVSTIQKHVSPNGVEITTASLSERIIAYLILNDIDGITLSNVTSFPTAILSLTQQQYAYDYQQSSQILDDYLKYSAALDDTKTLMNITLVNASRMPTTFIKLMRFNGVSMDTYSLTGQNGPEISSLFAFPLLNSSMLYLSIQELDYLNDQTGYNLFTTELNVSTLYSLEFLDFSPVNLLSALNSLVESIKLLTNRDYVRMSVLPLCMNPYRVGMRIVFSLTDLDYITDQFPAFNLVTIQPFVREISSHQIMVDPIKSNIFDRSIIPRVGTYLILRCQDSQFQQALGYMGSICRFVEAKAYSTSHTYYEIQGIVSQSRIACIDRLKTFRSNTNIQSQQLIQQPAGIPNTRLLSLTFFELVTQTDRLLLYSRRIAKQSIDHDLSDYGSGDFLNIMLTNGNYNMYDIESINIVDIPGVTYTRGILEWNEPLPYDGASDVFIYNSIFFNSQIPPSTMGESIINMLSSVKTARNIYFNLPFMTDALYNTFLPLGIVSIKDGRYYLQLGRYPAIPCLTYTEISTILATFPSPQWTITSLSPTLLDYYFTSRMINRQASSVDYYHAVLLHNALPFFLFERS